METDYAELHANSAFSFLRGATLPENMAAHGAEIGLAAMAVCDRDGLYGSPRFYAAAKETDIHPIIGAELTLEDSSVLPVLVENRLGYQNLCRLITRAKLRGPKSECAVRWNELPEFAEGLVCLTGDREGPLRRALAVDDLDGARVVLRRLQSAFGTDGVHLEVQRHLQRDDDRALAATAALARETGLPLLATNGPQYATTSERQVLDVMTCARHHTHLDAAGRLLSVNEARCLRNERQMKRLFVQYPEAVTNTVRLADRLRFELKHLGYDFPKYTTDNGESQEACLRRVTYEGARDRYGSELSAEVCFQLEKELNLIIELQFAGYFLIVWDLVNFAREKGIMVQGRGSAANSAVCYCLKITPVDAVKQKLLFERFLSAGRKSWPDIDLDLPSGDRREQVIQEVYQRYGKLGAAMTANVITYRGRSAMREIGKALNLPMDMMDRFSRLFAGGDFPHTLELEEQVRQAGLPDEHPRARAVVSLYQQFYRLPRHLGQHSGGMIIYQGGLDSIVPLENASMPGRVVAQWDKDDCDELGIIKVDLLGLGMMAVMQDLVELCAARGHPVDLAQIDTADPQVYDNMCAADTIGVFQIESRAQMATLPRMKPRCFYDVVIEVAIIRPGPIQGDMVHPYLQRRANKKLVNYFDPKVEFILERTLGVPLFQEQFLRIAMVMADFSGAEAEELRKALSFHRSEEKMQKVTVKLRAALEAKNVKPAVIEEILKATRSFALYGFPESHAISFAMLAYGSAWLKTHRAPEFFASLLNNQPMGFYSSATLVNDARRHGVKTRPVCVARSDWPCTIEDADDSVRLGLCVVNGLSRASADRLLAARAKRPFSSVADFMTRTQLHVDERRILAALGALNCLADHRRDALWRVEKPTPPQPDLFDRDLDPVTPLSAMNPGERLQADYAGMNLTTGPHAMKLLRPNLPADILRATDLPLAANGDFVRIAGTVICRQRPGTAKGFVFVSLEDETGVANAIVNPPLFEKRRLTISQEAFLVIEGQLQINEGTFLVKARQINALAHGEMASAGSHDFH